MAHPGGGYGPSRWCPSSSSHSFMDVMFLLRFRLVTHALFTLVIVAVSILGLPGSSPDVANAAPVAARGKKQPSGQDGNFLEQLLKEINARRSRAGARPLAFAPANANRAVDQYLADLTPVMMSYGACFHGNYNPVPPS